MSLARTVKRASAVTGLVAAAAAVVLVGSGRPQATSASSHREAPYIATDPSADNTDVYAFVSPDKPDTVTIIANFIPGELPDAGPNFYEFGNDVLYGIHINNDADPEEDVTYEFRFKTETRNPDTFLYNTGQITSLDDPHWNRPQFYSVTRVEHGYREVLGTHLRTPPVNIGPRSTPTYDALATAAINKLPGGRTVFAGQRDDPFFVDLGSVFDLLGLRPFNAAHLIPLPNEKGRDGLLNLSTHSIALQVPITDLTHGHVRPTSASDPNAVIGVYASASRHRVRVLSTDDGAEDSGPWVQISRLGEPLINEVIIPLGEKDHWNRTDPADDKEFVDDYLNPEPSALVNLLYPVLPDAATKNRQDLVTVLLTGIPGLTFSGNQPADLLRLNVAVPPAAHPDRLGALNGDFAGFPNGRRLADDVVDIEVRALACGYGPILHQALGLCDLSPNDQLGDGVDANDRPFLKTFPYVAAPRSGYEIP